MTPERAAEILRTYADDTERSQEDYSQHAHACRRGAQAIDDVKELVDALVMTTRACKDIVVEFDGLDPSDESFADLRHGAPDVAVGILVKHDRLEKLPDGSYRWKETP